MIVHFFIRKKLVLIIFQNGFELLLIQRILFGFKAGKINNNLVLQQSDDISLNF